MPLKGQIGGPALPSIGNGVFGGGFTLPFPQMPNIGIGVDLSGIRVNIPNFKIPVGGAIDRRDLAVEQGASPLEVYLERIRLKTIESAKENQRRASAQIQEILPVTVTAAPIIRPPVRISPLPTGGGLIPTNISTKGANNMALDLGSLLGNLGGAYIDARYNSTPSYNYGPSIAPPMTTPALGIPFVDVIPETSAANKVWDPRANCGQGKWIRRNKRRRRRLATASDIKDLAALKNVTSGPQMNTWIATHPT